MISEFALEPGLVATWHEGAKSIFFKEKFGLSTGRFVAIYPRNWAKLTWEAFDQGPFAGRDAARKNLDIWLSYLSQNGVKRRNSHLDKLAWLERTEAEHSERPFHAIISENNPRSCPSVICAPQLLESGDALWNVGRDQVVPRTAGALVAAAAPLLRLSRHALFIDPHFSPDQERFRKPFAGFLNELFACHYNTSEPIVELHTGIDRMLSTNGGDSQTRQQNVTEHLIEQMKTHLPRTIPRGRIVRVFIWKGRPQGERLHNRYILTDIAGILFGTGLDESSDPQSSETDDLTLLSREQLDCRWHQYKSMPSAFEPATEAFDIEGTRRG